MLSNSGRSVGRTDGRRPGSSPLTGSLPNKRPLPSLLALNGDWPSVSSPFWDWEIGTIQFETLAAAELVARGFRGRRE